MKIDIHTKLSTKRLQKHTHQDNCMTKAASASFNLNFNSKSFTFDDLKQATFTFKQGGVLKSYEAFDLEKALDPHFNHRVTDITDDLILTLSGAETDIFKPSNIAGVVLFEIKLELTDEAIIAYKLPDTIILKQKPIIVHGSISGNEEEQINRRTVFTKADLGLDNVDNTSDLDKPISLATQEILNTKQDLLISGQTIKTINNQTILGNGNIDIAGDFSEIPTKLSELINDVNFITNTTSNLTNYYKKAELDHKLQDKLESMVCITYNDLKQLRNNSTLIPGQQYKITNYNCTTKSYGTQSANHQFDIIVTADDANSLNENARACLHEGDTYFANSNLAAWELKYCIDNDNNRFSWVDETAGTGVIYYLKDEFGNEASYDFKNILFKRNPLSGFKNNKLDQTLRSLHGKYFCALGVNDTSDNINSVNMNYNYEKYCYTFSYAGLISEDIIDLSLNKPYEGMEFKCLNNIIKPLSYEIINSNNKYNRKLDLNNLCFITDLVSDNATEFCHNTIEENVYNCSIFGNACNVHIDRDNLMLVILQSHDIHIGRECTNSLIGPFCRNIKIENGSNLNLFTKNNEDIKLGINCSSNVFGDACNNIDLGNESKNNSFGAESCYINFGPDCNNNTVEEESMHIKFENDCDNNTIRSGNAYIHLDINSCDKDIDDSNILLNNNESETVDLSTKYEEIDLENSEETITLEKNKVYILNNMSEDDINLNINNLNMFMCTDNTAIDMFEIDRLNPLDNNIYLTLGALETLKIIVDNNLFIHLSKTLEG